MQTQNRIFDDIGRLFANAAGAAQGLREEIEVLVRSQAERLIAEFDLVTREEFDAARAMAAAARDEAEALAARVAALEAAIAAQAAPTPGAPARTAPEAPEESAPETPVPRNETQM